MPLLSILILASITIGAAVIVATVHLLVLAGMLRKPKVNSSEGVSLSVVVSARNEADRLGPLLESLERQSRVPDEIVVVDDRSNDGTSAIAEAYRKRLPMLRIVRVDELPSDTAPKKHALARGIAASRGDVLCLTDADGIVPVRWLESIEALLAPNVGVVVGFYAPLPAEGPSSLAASILERFISYEKYKSSILSAGSIGLGFPWTASGSNLAYRRAVYDQVGGFQGQHRSISGDDDLFVQRVRRNTRWSVAAMTDPATVVLTDVPRSWNAFYRQRMRHFSAGRWYDGWSKLWLALYHGANVIAAFSLLAAIVWPGHQFLIAFVIKLSADLLLCAAGDIRFRRPAAWTWFLPLELINVVYVATAGPLGWISRIRWKETRSS